MKKNIAIIAGGDSSEIVVSIKSAKNIRSYIDSDKYTPYSVFITKEKWVVLSDTNEELAIDKNDFSFKLNNEIIKFDFAYITIHGTPGEDGRLQGYFDLIGLPYSSCGMLASAITFNKFVNNHYLKGFGVVVPESVALKKGMTISNSDVIEKIGLPCFIKPNIGGSSFGVTKVKTVEQIQPAICKAFNEADEIIIESYIHGTEVTCGCYKTDVKEVVFPITEVVSKNEFFDFEAKYDATKADEITPARISEELTQEVKYLTSRIYDILGCKGIIRVDYIIMNSIPYLLEVNTTPGMTATSFIPQQVRAAGLTMVNVLSDILEFEFKKNLMPEDWFK